MLYERGVSDTEGGDDDRTMGENIMEITNKKVNTVTDKLNNVVAMIIWNDFSTDGIEFFSDINYSQQVAYMKRDSGYKIAPHIHLGRVRQIYLTQEVLLIKSGKIKVTLFDSYRQHLGDVTLRTGDIIHLISGGHSIEFLEESEIIEVKQGPYLEGKDKEIFDV